MKKSTLLGIVGTVATLVGSGAAYLKENEESKREQQEKEEILRRISNLENKDED